MLMGNFLRNRKSIRDFKRNKVEFEKLEEIMEDLKALNEEESPGNFKLRLYENGANIMEALMGKGGYAGVMIEAPHYIALDFLDDYDSTMIYGAYSMEKLITILNAKGLATCWVSLENLDYAFKQDVFGEATNDIKYLLAFGYQKPQPPFSEVPYSAKLGIEDFVFDEEVEKEIAMEKLETMGLKDLFYYIRFAPSTKNLQPWRFILKDTSIELAIAYEEWNRAFLMDTGVIMYYFEELAKYQGINNKWLLIDGDVYEGKKLKYKTLAVYQL